MILSGSLSWFLLLLIEKVKPDLFLRRQRYNLLKLSMAMHLLPFAWGKNEIAKWIIRYFRLGNRHRIFDGNRPIVVVMPDGIYRNHAYWINAISFGIWIFFAVVALVRIWSSRRRLRKNILEIVQKENDPFLEELKTKYGAILNIKGPVEIYKAKVKCSPFTFGVWNNVIVVPPFQTKGNMELMVYHEMCHIKQRDGVILILRSLLLSTFWFCPTAYILNRELETACEQACDEMVTQDMDTDEKKRYANLIIDVSVREESSYSLYGNAFCNNKKYIKERLGFIMRKTTKTGWSVLLAAGIFFCSAFPIFAYEGTQVLETDLVSKETAEEHYAPVKDFEFVPLGETSYFGAEIEEIRYDRQFIDEDGNIFGVREGGESKEKLACNHEFANGTYMEHTVKSNGGCAVKNYSAQRCSKCDSIRNKKLISKTEYAECPH